MPNVLNILLAALASYPSSSRAVATGDRKESLLFHFDIAAAKLYAGQPDVIYRAGVGIAPEDLVPDKRGISFQQGFSLVVTAVGDHAAQIEFRNLILETYEETGAAFCDAMTIVRAVEKALPGLQQFSDARIAAAHWANWERDQVVGNAVATLKQKGFMVSIGRSATTLFTAQVSRSEAEIWSFDNELEFGNFAEQVAKGQLPATASGRMVSLRGNVVRGDGAPRRSAIGAILGIGLGLAACLFIYIRYFG